MRRLLVPTLVLAAVLGLGMGADTQLISIRAYPSIVNTGAGQRVIVSGELTPAKANESVTVQGKECGVPGAFFRGLWGASTNEGGGWEAEFYVRTKTALRAVSGDDVSPVLTVQVRAPVHLAPMPGKPERFRVSAWAFGIVFRGKRVIIERFDPSTRTWRSVLSLVLDDTSSREGFRIPVRKGTSVRAHLPLSQAKPCFLGGYSKLIRT
jgi:hypothetical protein